MPKEQVTVEEAVQRGSAGHGELDENGDDIKYQWRVQFLP